MNQQKNKGKYSVNSSLIKVKTCVSWCENFSIGWPSNNVDRVLVPWQITDTLRLNFAILVCREVPDLSKIRDWEYIKYLWTISCHHPDKITRVYAFAWADAISRNENLRDQNLSLTTTCLSSPAVAKRGWPLG